MTISAETPTLREIRGPSALGGGLRRFADLVWLLSVTEFKLNYFGTAFGYLWSLMRPLLLFGVLFVVFTQILRFGGSIPHYAQGLLLCIMLYSLFSDVTTRAVGSVVAGENIVRKTQFPRLVIPLSVVLTGLFNLCLSLVAVLIFITASGIEPRVSWLALPLIVAAIALLTTGTSLLLSALFVRFRDIGQIWSVAVLAILYGSPILYPVEKVPHSLRFLLLVNPFYPILGEARRLIVDPTQPSVTAAAGSAFGWIGPAIVLVAVCGFGLWAFIRMAPRVAEEL